MKKICRYILFLPTVFMLGCAGYDRAYLITKTNIGIDIDSTPPTAEVTIARRELAIQPTYPFSVGPEKALPLLASFGLQGSFINPQITSYFAGGSAANNIVQGPFSTNANHSNLDSNNKACPENKEVCQKKESKNTAICLKKKPADTRGWLLYLYHEMIGKSLEEYWDEPRPFYFATDTSYGVKVAWSGTTGPYPDTLKLGYNRKELAAPPVFIEEKCSKDPSMPWEVKIPSFFASTDNASGFDSLKTGGVNHVQFFATGTVANTFAKRASVRRIAFEHMAPKAAKLETQFLNKSLFMEIKDNFDKSDNAKQQKIIAKAKSLNLVESSVTDAQFFSELEKVVTKYSSASTSNDLNILRVDSK